MIKVGQGIKVRKKGHTKRRKTLKVRKVIKVRRMRHAERKKL